MNHQVSYRPVLAQGRDVRAGLRVKRLMDVVLSLLLLVILSPMLVLIAVLVKTTSQGPAFYGLNWVGKDGARFRGFKFRTMVVDAEKQEAALAASNQMNGPAFKMANDPRVTPVGRILRKYSLDELPQLWSVLKGDLSLVGPRPPRDHEYARFTPFQQQKMTMKPGITCLWQVQGRHEITDFDEWVRLDLDYIKNWSLGLDVKILLQTAVVVFKGTGV